MNDDWRIRIDLGDDHSARQLGELLESEELEHDLERQFQDRIVVSIDEATVFGYAGSREQAEAVADLVRRLAGEHGWEPQFALAHWHPSAEEWEDPDVPLPADDAAAAQEHAERMSNERAESADQGYPDFEIRVQCVSRHVAGKLHHQLESEGIPSLHRWSVLLVGATDEDSANVLAERIRAEAPSACTVTVERNERAIYDGMPRSPFTLLGGLGG
jgi:hypothetical protein